MKNIIEIKNFTKKYGNIIAVNNISFNVKKGELFSFLGPNGAGKTTTINTLVTFLKKDTGDITISGLKLGIDDNLIREKIGIVFQNPVLDNLLTVKENLKIRGKFYNITNLDAKIEELSKLMQLNEFIDRPYGNLSNGEKRRCDIARALLNEPEILFLDEPTTGLDPKSRKIVWNIIKRLQKKKNITVFLSTHYMEEATISDRIAIINNGEIIALDNPENLRLKYSQDILKIIPIDPIKFKKDLKEKHIIKGNTFIINVDSSMKALEIMNKYKNKIESFEVIRGTMDDVFLNIIGKQIGEE